MKLFFLVCISLSVVTVCFSVHPWQSDHSETEAISWFSTIGRILRYHKTSSSRVKSVSPHNHHETPLPKGRKRTYYIAAVETDWDYAPSGENLVNNETSAFDAKAKGGMDRIGSVYKKVLYKEFTDETYTTEIPTPDWHGFLGPVIKAEQEEMIVVYFKNLAFNTGREFSIHPHGLLYQKDSEGALYNDNTNGSQKIDDAVAPGQMHRYVWEITSNFAPTWDDDKCLSFMYHSHVNAPRDISTGLMGPLLVCKRGALSRRDRTRRDVDREYFLYFDDINENESWLIEDNLQKCGDNQTCSNLLMAGDAAFQKSNMFPCINGYIFGNLNGLEAKRGEKIAWYFLGLESGIRGVQIYGQTFKYLARRLSSISLFPATFISATMTAWEPGRWLIVSKNVDEYSGGMSAFLTVQDCQFPFFHEGFFGTTRRYFISAEEEVWDYGPSGSNNFEGGSLNETGSLTSSYFTQGPHTIGGQYKKARYFQYTDETFQTKTTLGADEEHLGLLGPILRAEVGDDIEIVFKNMASRPYSILAHGVAFDKNNEGAVYKNDPLSDDLTGHFADPGETITYNFNVPLYFSPTLDDPDCLTNIYHSAVDPVRDVQSGLFGPLLVCKWGTLSDTGKQKTVDKEFVLLFMTLDENFSWYIDDNIQTFTSDPAGVDKNSRDFRQSNRMHAINGRMYANLDGLEMCKDDTVSWHVAGLGGFYDLHGVHFHGNTMEIYKQNKDAHIVIPGNSFTGEMCPDAAGTWAIVCRTNFHFLTGMKALYHVNKCGNQVPAIDLSHWFGTPQTRTYYIAAEEIEWDYAPLKIDPVTNIDLLDPSTNGYLYVRNDTGFIGSTYKKVVYREYTDATFTTHKVRSDDDEHLGTLGPVIRAEVDDTIEVVFKNKASRPYSIHPHGVLYSSENYTGGVYLDAEAVQPQDTHTYTWEVPDRAGPDGYDVGCASWLYYSFVNSVKDTSTGLIGPLVVCHKGILSSAGKRRDVDREFAIMFTVTDENQSWLLDDNIQTFAPDRTDKSDPVFTSSNQMNNINGYIYANLPGLVMKENENIAWYVMGMGSSLDIHTVHFHGQTFIHHSNRRHRGDVIEVFPSTSESVEMRTDNPGTWILHCHFGKHITAGMEAVYTIEECEHKNWWGQCTSGGWFWG